MSRNLFNSKRSPSNHDENEYIEEEEEELPRKWKWKNIYQKFFPQKPKPSSSATDVDLENGNDPNKKAARFQYQPRSFSHRLLTSIRFRNKLDTSRIVRLPYRIYLKYLLIVLLITIGAFLTPQLLPKWLGFEWASPQDLCQAPTKKLNVLENQIRKLANLSEAEIFLKQQKYELTCMNQSSAAFYHGMIKSPPRFLWPSECDSEKAKVSLTEKNCVQNEANVCQAVGGFLGFLASVGGSCTKEVGPPVCVESTNIDRADALLELEQGRSNVSQQANATIQEAEPIVSTANTRIQELISRLITQVDLAADAFILYSIFAIIIGIPLIIYKRERGSRVVGATFGLTKITFVVIFVILLSVYDSVITVFKETDFARLFENFLSDPCYIDPQFSSARIGLIVSACNNVTIINQESDLILQRMDILFYDTRLFGYCKDDTRELQVHPKLDAMDKLRQAYRNGNITSPGYCNATELNRVTSVAPRDSRVSKWKALLGSGVLAQLALKFIITGWILHLFAMIEPMVLHNGKVEIWGPSDEDGLAENEQDAVRRFARDRHLLPFMIFSLLLFLEIILIAYSIVTTVGSGAQEIDLVGVGNFTASEPKFVCPTSIYPL